MICMHGGKLARPNFNCVNPSAAWRIGPVKRLQGCKDWLTLNVQQQFDLEGWFLRKWGGRGGGQDAEAFFLISTP